MTVEVPTVTGQLVLHRCAPCDHSWWTLDGAEVRREAAHGVVSLMAPTLLRRRRRVVRGLPGGR